MANKTLLVAQREYLENIRTKTFWVGILAFPVLLVISVGAGWVLNKFKETQYYAVLDRSSDQIGPAIERTARSSDLAAIGRFLAKAKGLEGGLQRTQQALAGDLTQFAADAKAEPSEDVQAKLFAAFEKLSPAELQELAHSQAGLATAAKYRLRRLAELEIEQLPPEEQEKQLGAMLNSGRLFAYFIIGKQPAADLKDFLYVSNNRTDSALKNWYGEAATKVVQKLRIRSAGIDEKVAKLLQEEVHFDEKKVTETGAQADVEKGETANKFAPVLFVYLLWIAVFMVAQMLLTNTVEEKSNRIIEVLLSSVSPLELMSGKIWGIAATGLTIVLSWVVCALLGMWITPRIIAGFDFPLMAVIGSPLYLGSFLGYFLAGYLLYAAILVGLGSVCNSLKEAQNLLQPVFILLIIPLVSMMFVVQEPNGTVAKVLSWVPLFTPFTMMNRAGGPPELWEYAGTSVLLLISILIAFKAAGKIFRVGVLMTGKPPKLKEILGWLRAK